MSELDSRLEYHEVARVDLERSFDDMNQVLQSIADKDPNTSHGLPHYNIALRYLDPGVPLDDNGREWLKKTGFLNMTRREAGVPWPLTEIGGSIVVYDFEDPHLIELGWDLDSQRHIEIGIGKTPEGAKNPGSIYFKKSIKDSKDGSLLELKVTEPAEMEDGSIVQNNFQWLYSDDRELLKRVIKSFQEYDESLPVQPPPKKRVLSRLFGSKK